TGRDVRLDLVRRCPAPRAGDGPGAARVRARRASRRPDRREGGAAAPRCVPARPPGAGAPPGSGRDGVEPPRGGRVLVRGAAPTHARLAARGGIVGGTLPDVLARAAGPAA